MTSAKENGGGAHSLQGRVALVTGAARGIGKAIALELAHRHASVAVHYRKSETEAEALAEQIRASGTECLVVQGDVASKDDAGRVVGRVLDTWNRLDVLVNNAGITRLKSSRNAATDDWTDVVDVNLSGTYHCTNAALPHMIQQRFGRIINVTSHMWQGGQFRQGGDSGEGEIVAFTKAVALEVARYNITANTIAPGFTSTEMLANLPPQVLEQIRAQIPLGRLAHPEEVAQVVGFLATHGGYITGQQLHVDGGLCMSAAGKCG